MTSISAFNLEVDQVFEQNSIFEVETINRRIQVQIESKREELRLMVGERYRDLIQAADTIAEMKTTSLGISANIISLSQNQNHDHLTDFNNEQRTKTNKSGNKSVYGVVMQIKILTTLPELIWSRIDEEDFFVATQLFILSRHISTGLKLDVNSEIMRKFPVAKKQWDLLSPFFYTIKQRCLQALERENLTPKIASTCLASLMLLENCHLEKLLTGFVQTRSRSLRNIAGNDNGVVKEKLLKSLKVLTDTVSILHACFIGKNGKKGLLIQELESISDDESEPTLNLLQQRSSSFFQTLPDIISKYKPQVSFGPFDIDSLQSTMKSWLDSVEIFAQNELKSLVHLIVSIKTIRDIQQQAHEKIELPRNWRTMCNDLFLPANIDFFKTFYQPLINERIGDIVRISWSTIQIEMHSDVEKLIVDNDKVHRDMKSYVWTEDKSDNPLSLKDATSHTTQSHRLLMKVNCFTPATVEVCSKIDKHLEMLLTDLKTYLGGVRGGLSRAARSNETDPDCQKIVAYLQDCSRDNISTLITAIKSSKFSKTAENYITLARLLQSMSELCPNLRLCFSGYLLEPSFLRDPTRDTDGEEAWKSICDLLEEESLNFWRMWMIMFVGELKPLNQTIDWKTTLSDFPRWESMLIEEKDESDKAVQSKIEIPIQICISVQCWLFDAITCLGKIVPHTLPRIVHLEIVESIVERIYNRYNALATDEFVKNCQKASWQFFFDVKVLMLMFVSRENKLMIENFNCLANEFKSFIDPFDFDVFYHHVNHNIKRNAAWLQQGMGFLVTNMEHLSSTIGNFSMTSPLDKDPNIFEMSSADANAEWLSLLPVIAIREIGPMTLLEDVKKKDTKVNPQTAPRTMGATRKQQAQSSSSSALTDRLQDWFR